LVVVREFAEGLDGAVFGEVSFFGGDGDFLFTVFFAGDDFDFGDAFELGGEGLGDVLFAGHADDAGDGAFIGGEIASAEGGGSGKDKGGEGEQEVFHEEVGWRVRRGCGHQNTECAVMQDPLLGVKGFLEGEKRITSRGFHRPFSSR